MNMDAMLLTREEEKPVFAFPEYCRTHATSPSILSHYTP